MSFRAPFLSALCLLLGGLLTTQPATAQYQQPQQDLVDLLDAPLTPRLRIHPQGRAVALLDRPSQPTIATLAEPELRLAGIRVKTRSNARSWTLYSRGITLVDLEGRSRPVTSLPPDAHLENFRWSPDGEHFAFTHTTADGLELWTASLADAEARRLTGPILNLAMARGISWLPDSSALVTTVRPANQRAVPSAPTVPSGPVIQETTGKAAPARTYQDLLKSRHDEALFDHYFTSQVARIGLDGKVERLTDPAIVWQVDPSPDGRYLLLETLHRPYSYLVPAFRFPRRIAILDGSGEVVHELADRPLMEGVPTAFGSVVTGPRQPMWRADVDASLAWAEALDGGDAGAEAKLRDRLYLLAAPFTGEPQKLADLELRFSSVQWGHDDLALVSTWWWKSRQTRAWRVHPASPAKAPKLVHEGSFEDRYGDPGEPVMQANARGRQQLLTLDDGKSLVMIGDGASEEGDRPFLDLWNLDSDEKQRLFRSQAPHYERPLDILSADGQRFLTLRESVEEPPNLYVRDLTSDSLQQITDMPHPTPQLLGVSKELIRYRRADGVQLTGTLYLPKGYEAERDGPLPTMLWAYPQEFKSADAAGQVTDSPHRFTRIGWWSPMLWLTQGYAVLDDPTLPIIGEGDDEPNDTYVEQLVNGAAAAIDELVRRGVGDRDRMVIGGHSYGAFMTANLLAHSDLFAAGIARSGAYNRTLTPFGFQAEERSVWQAPEIYFAMSPFMHADKVNEPILLIHGQVDNNSGTYPMQSERFYNALKGLGATARLVMLPHESHGYRARESILHMLWETERWLDTYVKNKPQDEAQAAAR
ncbi:MAG: prolyl oligopeptidase family serine peptidase [Acidobacteriota bacterium]